MKPDLKDWIGCLIPALIGITLHLSIIYVIFHFINKYW